MRGADRPVRRQVGLRVLALTAVLVTVAACGQSEPVPRPDDARPTRALTPIFSGAETLPAPDLTDDGPGSLVEMKLVKGDRNFDEAGATAARIVYRSTSGVDGRPTQVSALIAVPAGPPPKGGWPIISFGHEATGVLTKCAPTLAAEFWGYSSGMAVYLRRGFAIVMSDYYGLGVDPGPNEPQHSILDAPTLGNNIIDAARAIHRVAPSTSTNWGALGAGEGGLAAWAAAERAGAYGAGMNMVGAVAVNPIADLAPLADPDRTAALATAAQYQLQIRMLQSLQTMQPDFDLNAHRSAKLKDQWDLLVDCAPRDVAAAQLALNQLTPNDFAAKDAAAVADLKNRLSAVALPSSYAGPNDPPVLVAFGTADSVDPAAGVLHATGAACARGQQIVMIRRVGDTGQINDQTMQNALAWLQARFDGQQVTDACVGAT
jgi:predicted small lipoprotein YifL